MPGKGLLLEKNVEPPGILLFLDGLIADLHFPRRAFKAMLSGKNDRRLLFISCFPKSGSTYLMRLLSLITGYDRVMPVQNKVSNEHDIDERKFRRLRFKDGICQQHTKGTLRNVQLLKSQGVRTAVLVRNIFDVVVSLCDHFHNESRYMPTGYVPKEFFTLSEDNKRSFVIRLHIPWYFNYLLSWQEARHELPVEWVTYEELFADRSGTVCRLLEFWDLPVDRSRVTEALREIEGVDTRLNKGRAGRGELLSDDHRRAIIEIADTCGVSRELRESIGI